VSRLHPVQHCSAQAQIDRELIHARALLVRLRVSMTNHVRSVVKVHGYRLRSCSTECFVKKGWPQIPEELRSALTGIFLTLDTVSRQIVELDKKIEAVGRERYPVTRMFADNIPGIAMLTATAFALRIEDPRRFANSRQVGAYLGLVQRKHKSGQSDPHLGITKAGDGELRRLLVLAANYILGRFCKDCDLRRFGERIARGGGKNDRKRAKVAIARKLAVLMHLMWKRGEVYDPQHQMKLAGKLQPS
jgi:transposase